LKGTKILRLPIVRKLLTSTANLEFGMATKRMHKKPMKHSKRKVYRKLNRKSTGTLSSFVNSTKNNKKRSLASTAVNLPRQKKLLKRKNLKQGMKELISRKERQN